MNIAIDVQSIIVVIVNIIIKLLMACRQHKLFFSIKVNFDFPHHMSSLNKDGADMGVC